MTEVVEVVALIRDRVDLPLVVDADNGYGNALNVQRTVRMFERAGATAIQLEDQTLPKRCGHLRDKTVIPAGGDGGQDPRRGRCPRQPIHPDHRTDRRRGHGRGERRDRSRRAVCGGRGGTCCSWRHRRAARSWPR